MTPEYFPFSCDKVLPSTATMPSVVVGVIVQQLKSYHQLSRLRKFAPAARLSHRSCTVSCIGWLWQLNRCSTECGVTNIWYAAVCNVTGCRVAGPCICYPGSKRSANHSGAAKEMFPTSCWPTYDIQPDHGIRFLQARRVLDARLSTKVWLQVSRPSFCLSLSK